LAARLNQCCEVSAGRDIARKDADDAFFPDRFARQVARLNAESSPDMATCQTWNALLGSLYRRPDELHLPHLRELTAPRSPK